MKSSCVKYYSLAIAAASLMALGLGCNSSDPQNLGGGDITPPKEIPVVNEPPVKINFFEPEKVTEEEFRDGKYYKDNYNYGYLIAKVKPGFKTAFFERLGFKVAGSITADGSVYYRLHKESGVLEALKMAKRHAGLLFIEPEVKNKLHAVETNPVTFTNPDAYLLNKGLYSVYTTKAYDAWLKHGFGPNKPVVANIDSGIKWDHQDLLGQVKHAYSWWRPNASGTNWQTHVSLPEDNTIPLDGERLVNLIPDMTKPYLGVMYYSTDFESGGGDGHGTHTSGTICAIGNNGVGGAGICWNAELVHYKMFNDVGSSSAWSGYGSIWHLARWKEVYDYKAAIPVNASWGSSAASQFGIDMIAHGLRHGIIMVTSAGNDGQNKAMFPSSYSGVIAVGSTNGHDERAGSSTYGRNISVMAPGEFIVSTVYTGTAPTAAGTNTSYAYYSGTSMASPHVTGLIGYMLNFNPELKVDQIKTLIEQNADLIDGKTGFSEEYGWGRINVLKTIEAVISGVNNGTTPPSNYAINPVRVKPAITLTDLGVHLYNCSQDGTIQNYCASSIVDTYMADMTLEGDDGFQRTNNVAYFNMLRPGWYVAKAYIGAAKKVATTDPFQVTVGMAPLDVSMVFDAEMLTIQTFATQDIKTAGANGICDTQITIYDGREPVFFDYYLWEKMTTVMPTEPSANADGAYHIKIDEFDGNDTAGGEYALWITKGAEWDSAEHVDPAITDNWGDYPIAPGTYANPVDGEKSAQATVNVDAQTFDFNKLYYGRFNGAPGDGGTSGALGHWYKFSVATE